MGGLYGLWKNYCKKVIKVFFIMFVFLYFYEVINRSLNYYLCVFKILYFIFGCGGLIEMEIKLYYF